MLEKVTWTQYSLTLLTVLAFYYAVVLAKYFRAEIRGFFSHHLFRKSPSGSSPSPEEMAQAEVMGKPKPDPGVTYFASDQIRFAPEPPSPAEQDSLLRQVPEVLQEFRSICEILEKENGGKEDLAFLLESLRLQFPLLEQSPHLSSLLENLREQLPFELSEQELLQLWQPK